MNVRNKGKRLEYKVRDMFRELGEAERVPVSGIGRLLKGDVVWKWRGEEWKIEVKGRKHGAGFRLLEKWLGSKDILVLVENRKEPLIVIPWDKFKKLVSEGLKNGSVLQNFAPRSDFSDGGNITPFAEEKNG